MIDENSHGACRRGEHKFLNDFQHKAVHEIEGAYVLAACAGSGKTRVVIQRIEQMINVRGIPPSRIGAFTFAKDAAAEMNTRGQALSFPKDLRVGTLHSLCWEIIRDDGAQWTGGDPRMDETLHFALKNIVTINYRDRELDVGTAAKLIGLAKANCLSYHPLVGADYEQDILELFQQHADRSWLAPYYAAAFREFEQVRHQRGVVDYDDMLILAWLALTRSEGVREKWRQRFDYLLVDEAQDSSKVQNAVADILSERTGNIMLIGDCQQSLYRWRGAIPEQFYDYATKFKLLTLPINYRSTKQICEYATRLTANCKWNVTGPTIPHEGAIDDPDSAVAVEYENPESEAQSIVEGIKSLLVDGASPKDIAILYRVTWLAYPIEDALLRAGLPYVVWSGMNFFERREVRDLLAYLRVATLRDPDESQIKRTIHAPFRYLGKAYVAAVEEYARQNNVSFADGLRDFTGAKESQTRNGRRLYETLKKLNEMISQGTGPKRALDFVIQDTRYLSFIKKDEGQEGPDPDSGRAAHVHQLFRVASAFSNVVEFLDYVDRTTAALNEARGKKDVDAVTLSSIHRFKGLEKPFIYGIGWNEGTLPHAKNPDQDEELRLAYVCITRAQRRFQASWCRHVVAPTGTYAAPPSQYIVRSGMPVRRLPNAPAPAAPQTQQSDYSRLLRRAR